MAKFYLRSIFVAALAFSFLSVVSAQDLTGTWEGTQSGSRKQDVFIYLKRLGTGYTGVVVVKSQTGVKALKNLITSSIASQNATPDNNKRSMAGWFFAKFENERLTGNNPTIFEQTNSAGFTLYAPLYNYSSARGKETLLANYYGSKVELTHTSDQLPAEYTRYLSDLISVNSISFTNSKKQPLVTYNDKGLFSFSIANNTDLSLYSLTLSIKTLERNSGITGLERNKTSFSLEKGKVLQPEIDIYSGFDIPEDSIHFLLEANYQNATIFSRVVAIPTNPFFVTKTVSLNKSSEQVLPVLKGYYGFDKATYSPIKNNLLQFSQSGGRFSNMWLAVFQSMGKGGFDENTDAAVVQAKKDYSVVLESARKGDAEAQYLMFYAIGMGLAGDNLGRDVAGRFLKNSAEAGFSPAMYDYALYLMRDTAYPESLRYLTACYDKGMLRAGQTIAAVYKNGLGVPKDYTKALEWYQKVESFGDPDIYLSMARMYNVGDDNVPADGKKAIIYANKAVDLKSTAAMNFLARVYLNGRPGVPKNTEKALAMYKTAAALGDHESMTSLAYIYYFGSKGVIAKDEKTGISWARKSAEAGAPGCMALLSELYATGKIDGTKDVIRSRFWANQARLHGIGDEDNTAAQAAGGTFMNILGNIDFSDKYSYYKDVQTGDVYRSNDGPDLFGGLFSGFMGAYKQSRAQQQEVINGVKLMYQKGNKKIYGGTLTSKLTTDIVLFGDQKVKINAYGSVSLGMMAGVSGPSGIYGFQSYSVDPSIPHGSVMAGINNKWTFIGTEKKYAATSDGRLQLAINDGDYSNNKGYYDVVIEVTQ